MNLDVGSIAGDYQVIGTLGAGGMGKVFKVRNTISDRIEAMKILLPDLTGSPDLADRFLREIKVHASLDHPNIAALRTAVRFENQLLMIMELVEGITLEQRLKQGPLSVTEAVEYVGQVLAALSYAHRAGVVHRDIKPANMMLTPSGTIKLMDFGIAKSANDRKLTMTGTTMGSLYYMSPEQIRGVETLDARADLYSVGVSLYELVTGKRPFDGDSQFSIMSAHLEKTPVPPVAIDPKLPATLNDVILLSVQKDPNARFQTADAFRNALASVIAPATVPRAAAAAAQAAAPPVAQAPKSRRGLWMAAGAVAAVLAIVAVIQFAPKKEAAAGNPPAPAPVVEAPAPAAESPAAAQTPPPLVAPPQVDTAAKTVPAPTPARPTNPAPSRPANSAASQIVNNAPPPAQAAPVQASPAQTPPAQAPSVQTPPKQATASPDLEARRAELQKTRESLALLAARATAVRSLLQGIQRSQAASGLGMRSDWVQASSLMESFLQGANNAVNASDVAAAQDLMTKAERQIDKLETALNK